MALHSDSIFAAFDEALEAAERRATEAARALTIDNPAELSAVLAPERILDAVRTAGADPVLSRLEAVAPTRSKEIRRAVAHAETRDAFAFVADANDRAKRGLLNRIEKLFPEPELVPLESENEST